MLKKILYFICAFMFCFGACALIFDCYLVKADGITGFYAFAFIALPVVIMVFSSIPMLLIDCK